jgi:hypothetical protein
MKFKKTKQINASDKLRVTLFCQKDRQLALKNFQCVLVRLKRVESSLKTDQELAFGPRFNDALNNV